MIESQEGLMLSQEQLVKLRDWEKKIVNDLDQHPRLKKSELAGIRSMIAQIEREIRIYNLSRLQSSILDLEEQVQKLDTQFSTFLTQKIRTIREVADALHPVI